MPRRRSGTPGRRHHARLSLLCVGAPARTRTQSASAYAFVGEKFPTKSPVNVRNFADTYSAPATSQSAEVDLRKFLVRGFFIRRLKIPTKYQRLDSKRHKPTHCNAEVREDQLLEFDCHELTAQVCTGIRCVCEG